MKMVSMQLLYCGWNGFGQVPNHTQDILAALTLFQTEEPVTSVSCSWSALCVVSGSHIYVFGFLDGEANCSKKLSLENGDFFQQVVNNSKHLVALSNSKQIWRRSTADKKNPKFVLLSLGELKTDDESKDFIEKVSCSDNICVALTNSGNLYAIPSRINNPSLVVRDVACGNEHTIFLTETGSVYSYGQGSRGQLGHGELEAEEEPREVDALAGLRMAQVTSGGWHCAVISEEGDLYTWGWNRFGQLGVEGGLEESKPKEVRLSSPPQGENSVPDTLGAACEKLVKCPSNDGSGGVYASPQLVGWTEKRVASVSCGTRHTVVLLEDGTLWGCGWNAYGQLGISPDSYPQVSSMTRIPISYQGKLASVICGGWSTCILVS